MSAIPDTNPMDDPAEPMEAATPWEPFYGDRPDSEWTQGAFYCDCGEEWDDELLPLWEPSWPTCPAGCGGVVQLVYELGEAPA